MKVPENPYRKALASLYMEKYLGKPEGDLIKKAVNGKNEGTLDYYIGAERIINNAMQVFMTVDEKELHSAGGAFSVMLSYVSYEIERLSELERFSTFEIERLSVFKNKD